MRSSRFSAAGVGVALFDAVLIALLALIGSLWGLAVGLAFGAEFEDGRFLLIIQGVTFFVLVVGLFVLRRVALKRRWLTAVTRTLGAASVAGVCAYLAWDEPVAPSVVRNEALIAERFTDERTYLLTMRYSAAPGAAREFSGPTHALLFNHAGVKRTEYLLAHREKIEANWTELVEVRAWCSEMAAEAKLGDRLITDMEMPVMRYAPLRVYNDHALAMATLLALDGNGDAALAQIEEVYRIGVLLEPAACTLVRAMIAIQARNRALETAEFVLEHAQVSGGARERFAALLESGASGEAGARRLLLTESSFWTADWISGTATERSGEGASDFKARMFAGLMPLVLNAQATSNRMNDYFEEQAAFAGARDIDAMKVSDELMRASLLRPVRVKNLSGRLLMTMGNPTFSTVVRSHWKGEDIRARLVGRLREGAVTGR